MLLERDAGLYFQKPEHRRAAGNSTPPGDRRAYAKTAAPSGNIITCYLGTDLTGTEIEVTCDIAGGPDLFNAGPRIELGTPLWVRKVKGVWHCKTLFMGSEDCPE